MTFKEQLMKFLDDDPDRWSEQIPKPGDHEKYGLEPTLASTIHMYTHSASEVTFDFDAEGNLLDVNTVLICEEQALREIAKHPALDEKHANILICSACHIDEYDETQVQESAEPEKHEEEPPKKKRYLN